jgi:lipoate-protein ligase A
VTVVDALPDFGFVSVHERALADGIAAENEWMLAVAVTGRAAAHLWSGDPGLVAPRNCMALPGWADAARTHAVQVRATGGGVVPQGAGVVNLSLVWRADSATPTGTDAIYRALCDRLSQAFATLGVHASAQAVAGSFCDGRFNLAAAGRKLVGTAQSWRRIAGRTVVLAHAVIIASADPLTLTDAANAFERDLGSGREYRADALTSFAIAWQQAHDGAAPPADLDAQLTAALAMQFARMVAPTRVTFRAGPAPSTPPDRRA